MAKPIQHYCELLRKDIDDPIEVTLRGQNTRDESANVFPTTDIANIKTLASLIKSQSTKTLGINLIELTSYREVFNTFMTCMAGSTSINSLTVDGSFVGDEELSYLIPVLHCNEAMSNLEITNAAITADGMRMLYPFISGRVTLTKLKLSLLQWTDVIAHELAEALLIRETALDALSVIGGLSSSGVTIISEVEVKSK